MDKTHLRPSFKKRDGSAMGRLTLRERLRVASVLAGME